MKHINFSILMITLTILTACGGGSGGGNGGGGNGGGGNGGGGTTNSNPTTPTYNAQFIDAPVKGLSMVSVSSGTTVVTTDNGMFNCTKGEELQVKIAGLLLGTAYCDTVIFVQDMTETAGSSIGKIASVIQSFAEHKTNGDLDLSTPVYGSNELASIDLSASDTNLENDISALLAGRTSPVTTNLVDVSTANTNVGNQEVANGAISSDEADKYTSFLTTGTSQSITLYGKNTNHGGCLANVTLKYSLDLTNGVYRLTGDEVSSTGHHPNQESQVQMANNAFQTLRKIISTSTFYVGSQTDVSATLTQARLQNATGVFPTLSLNVGAYPSNYRAKVRLAVSPANNGDAVVDFEYTAMRVDSVAGPYFDLSEVTCKYED